MFGRHLQNRLLTAAIFLTTLALADVPPVRPARTYDLKNVEWHLTIHPETGGIDGDVINTVHLLKPEDSVTFDCGPLTISSITVNGTPSVSDLYGENLTVKLPDKGANRDYKVEIRYSGKPTAGVYFIDAAASYPAHTSSVYSIGTPEDNRYWLPTYDFPDNKATSEGFITVPKGWKALSNGKYLGEKTDGGQTTIHWKMDQPHSTYLISFVAGKYEVGEEKWGRMPVQYWVPEGLIDWGKATFGGTNKIIDFYSKQLKFKYPYAKFAQSTVPQFIFGGVENISAVTQSSRALFPPDEVGNRNSTNLIAHELAHQWFGDMISCSNWTHTWLSESFATLMPPFYTRATSGDDAFQRERKQIFGGALSMRDNGPVAWDHFDYPGDVYRGQIYSGGAARLYMLMYKLGEKKFWAGIHDFLEAYKFKPVSTDQFFASMSKSTGQDLNPFMKQWFYGGGIPEIAVKADGSSLVFTRSQPAFDMDPEAWIWDGSHNDWVKKQLHFSSAKSECRVEVGLDLSKAPIIIDPEGHWLLSQTSSNLIPADQAAAIYDNLPAFSKAANYPWLRSNQAALAKLIVEPANKPYFGVLVAQLDATNLDLLSKCVQDEDPEVRTSTIQRIRRQFRTELNDRIAAVLKNVSDRDRYPVIRESAYACLMQVAHNGALAEKAWTTDVFGDTYRVDALNWWAAHDRDTARRHCLEALEQPMSEPVQAAAIQILGRIHDAKGERAVFNDLVKVVQGTALNMRQSAIQALTAYGDKAAIPVLDPLTHSSLYITKSAAIRAITALEGGDSE